jgi:hypothetical protein
MKPRRLALRVYTLFSKERIMSKSLKILILAGALSASAGAADTPPTPRQIAPPTRIPDIETLAPLPAGEPVSTAQMPRTVRRAVVTDAAKRFNVAESEVVLARAEQVTWSDGSLGCPEPGRMYTQMLVAGYRVVATTGAGALTYHTDSRGTAVSCSASARARARPEDTGNDPSAPHTQPPPRTPPDR